MTIKRARTLKAAIPFILLHGTDAQAINTTPVAMTWVRSLYGTSEFIITLGTSKIKIAKESQGLYEIIASGGVEKSGGNPTHATFVIYVNGVAMQCCTADSVVGALTEHSDVCLYTAIYLNSGDIVEVYVSIDAGTGVIEDNTARLIIKGVPMEGWNNRFGSKKYTKGRL